MNIETTLNLLKVCPMNLWAKVRTGKHRRNRDLIANMLQLWQLWCQQQGKNYDDNNDNDNNNNHNNDNDNAIVFIQGVFRLGVSSI